MKYGDDWNQDVAGGLAIVDALRDRGAQVKLDTPVENTMRGPYRLRAVYNGQTFTATDASLTTSARLLAGLVLDPPA